MFRKIRKSILWKVLRIMVRFIIWLMYQIVSLILFIIAHILIPMAMAIRDWNERHHEWKGCKSIDPRYNIGLDPRGYRTINLERLRRRP